MMPSNNLIPRIYSSFRGVDFRGEEINLVRSPDALNVWKDYKEIDSIRTRPSLETLEILELIKKEDETINGQIYGIYFYEVNGRKMMFVHIGTHLWKIENGEATHFSRDINPIKSNAFIYNNVWYFKDGKKYMKYDGTQKGTVDMFVKVDAYVPTTSIARKPLGGGTIYEDVNMLTGRRKNSFLADGESKEYFLDAKNIDEKVREFDPRTVIVTVNDEEVSVANYTVDTSLGKVTFKTAPPKPLTDGQDNVVIEFKKEIEGYKERILNCTLLEVFDNRVFFSGNPDYPNVIWHCSLDDPTYCSDLDYYNEGLDNAMVRGLVAGNNALWVFKESSQANTTVFYHTPTIDVEYGKIYPSTHSSISLGCAGRAINFNDDIVFFSERGMEGITEDITKEQILGHRSTMIDRRLTAEPNYKNMILEEWEGYLLVFIDNKVYLADSRGMFTNETHMEYEWFYWELEKNVTYTKVHNGVLYIGTEDGVIYTLNGVENVESYWTTPKDKFKYPQHLKTTNKRGCVVEATGDISVSVKTEKTDFELIGEYKNVTDYFVSRIKRKKFKDIQIKFHSQTRFSLETATLECFVGGYLKR